MIGRAVARIACALVLLAALASAAGAAQKRVALVIGNGAYTHIPALDNPKNDAALIAGTLASLGFTLVGGGAQFDLDRQGFENAIRSFGREIGGADVALFYYAGHGLQVSGTNWLVPVTADPAAVTDLDYELVDAQLVLKQMEAARTRLNLILLDACRNNPFRGRGFRDAAAAGLTQMKSPEGTLISFATQPGSVARDGQDHSPYSAALATAMRTPGLDVFQLFNAVGLEVKKETGGEQEPWVSTSPIDGAFYMAGLPPPKAPPAAARDTGRFDGVWLGTIHCPPAGDIAGYAWQFIANIHGGHVSARRGVTGEPDSIAYDGAVARDGKFALHAEGRTGEPPYTPAGTRPGSPYSYDVVGHLDERTGTGKRLGQRPCTFEFVRQ